MLKKSRTDVKQESLYWDPSMDARFEHWTYLHPVMLMDDIHDFIVEISRMPFLSGWTHILSGTSVLSATVIHYYDSEQIQLQQIRPHATPAQKKQQQKHHHYEKIRTRFTPVLFPFC